MDDETFVADSGEMDDAGTMQPESSDLEAERLRAESIAIVRELILKANQDLVPELVRGESLAELTESVEPARTAFRRIAERVRAVAPVVPAGGAGAGLRIAIEELSADGLIKQGLVVARN